MATGGTGGKRAVVIAGPTASGKSALAVRAAERLGGAVINADAMQVYADLRILTARPSDDDLRRAPHRLFGYVDAAEAYSVGRWLREMTATLDDCAAAGRMPVIVGGTGLYLRALMDGLSPIPDIPADVRARVRGDAAGRPSEALHAELEGLDPAMAARLRPSDRQRVTRALEVVRATGQSLAAFQALRSAPLLPAAEVAGLFLAPGRAPLTAAIDRRLDRMVEAGALEEVARLARRTLDPALPAMKALGVPPLLDHLAGRTSLPDALAAAKHATRLYAKRQMTFGRHQLGLPWIDPASTDLDGALTILIERVRRPAGSASPPGLQRADG